MKIDRLIGIVTLLLQKDAVTMPFLAARFEVSYRTIQRDIDALCRAGIPIAAEQGFGGGVRIADGYRIDPALLTEPELQAVLAGVKSLDGVTRTAYRQSLLEKLSRGRDAVTAAHDTMLIDLVSWYQDSLPDKIGLIREAIVKSETISFLYYSEQGEGRRTIEPCVIAYRWDAWYVYGYCLDRQEFRLFKLNRLWDLRNEGTPFEPREVPAETLEFNQTFGSETIGLEAVFMPAAKHRLIEEYGPASFTQTENGSLLFRRPFANRSYMIQWLLSFGGLVKVLRPADAAETIRNEAERMAEQYRHTDP